MNIDRHFGWGSVLFAFVTGLLIGWFAIGWGAWPVEWTNTDPVDLRQEAREDYLVLVANDYAITHDATTALRRLATWESPSDAGREIRELAAYRRAQGDLETAGRLEALANELPLPTVEESPQPEEMAPPISPYLLRIGGAVLILVGIVAATIVLLRRQKPGAPEDRLREGEELAETAAKRPEERGLPTAKQEGLMSKLIGRPITRPMPLGEFEFVYTYEGPQGEFDRTITLEKDDQYLGECGMGVASYLDEHTQQVNALEVWLFDKSDIHTESKILMTPQAYNDEAMREKFAEKGELIPVEGKKSFTLEGHSLRARAEIEDAQYLPGEPLESAFRRLAVRLKVSRQESEERL